MRIAPVKPTAPANTQPVKQTDPLTPLYGAIGIAAVAAALAIPPQRQRPALAVRRNISAAPQR